MLTLQGTPSVKRTSSVGMCNPPMLTFTSVFARLVRLPARTATSVWNGTRIKHLLLGGPFATCTLLSDGGI
ncbi:MAG TPA: hypothetical protein VMM54_15300 [Nitrospirota bacterium]|nr:hypothetical protein [Nitrospirota bacterium]